MSPTNMNLANRNSKAKDDRRLDRSESFSKSKKPNRSKMSSVMNLPARKVAITLVLVTMCSLLVLMGPDEVAGRLAIRRRLAHHEHIITLDPSEDSPWFPISSAAYMAEQFTLMFFHGDARALDNGVPIGGTKESTTKLAERLAHRIAMCHSVNLERDEDCVLRVAFVGSAQTTGRDVFHNESFPFVTEKRLRPIAEAAGLELQVVNNGMDSDISKEGPQSTHMCVTNQVGKDVDVIAWDLDGSMQAEPAAQMEAFLRWTFASEPAMIMINRGGPHGRSRRGKRRSVVNIGPNHNAEVWDDKPEDIPEQHEEEYVGSDSWKARWEEGRNEFWNTLIEKYSPHVDIAAVDPSGAIWTLDHLESFSNVAFDAEKILPLVDCGNEHPPPCDQVPPFIANKLTARNLTVQDLATEEQIAGGKFCSATFGCRSTKYGGKRSHELRGELNALPIARALRSAAGILASPSGLKNILSKKEAASATSVKRALSVESLPPPEHCSEVFCNLYPTCMTSYFPNLGPDLMSTFASPITMPRKGAAHFADDPDFQIQNLEKQFAPLGYVDRKFAYRLAVDDGVPKMKMVGGNMTDEEELQDTANTDIIFSTTGAGPLVLCEPPCLSDVCSKQRKMPLIRHVTLELDSNILELPNKELPVAAEVGGPFCKTIAASVPAGDHTLRIITNLKAPQHVMFSHLIAFS